MGERGLTLVEVVIALALTGVLGFALVQGLSAMALSQRQHDEQTAALIAAQGHIEKIKRAAYDPSVTSTPGPAYLSLATSETVGYIPLDLAASAQLVATDVQLVTVVASSGGLEILHLQTYKVNR
ncbi:MAG: prepilin-type N-terminal cleavage/methylation domain-containing protein [Chloroflexota bacterium]|nr:prepilin-type N-terminal cleavage/methylation domain-containing protein [Chloroflexota bacterium]